jgi:hypothetical protein
MLAEDAISLAPGQLEDGGGHLGIFDLHFQHFTGRKTGEPLLVFQQADRPSDAHQVELVRCLQNNRLPRLPSIASSVPPLRSWFRLSQAIEMTPGSNMFSPAIVKWRPLV